MIGPSLRQYSSFVYWGTSNEHSKGLYEAPGGNSKDAAIEVTPKLSGETTNAKNKLQEGQ
jgi:hypothetical protein